MTLPEPNAPPSSPSGLVTLSTLSSQLGFLPPSPAWPEVERAIDRLLAALETGLTDPDGDQDVRIVQSYSAMLRDHLPFLTILILVAMVVGRLAARSRQSPTRGEQLLRGLQAVRWAKEVDGVEVMDHLMDPLWAWARSESPSLLTVGPDLGDDLARWADRMGGRLDMIASEVTPTLDRLESARRNAWDAWRSRVWAYLGAEVKGQPITPEDLLCHAAGYAPARAIRTNLQTMSITDWSRLVYLAFARDVSRLERVRPWLAEAALRALGFEMTGPEFRSLPPRKQGAPGILVIRQERDSQVVRWTPSQTLPIVAWTAREASALAESASTGLATILAGPGRPVVAVEVRRNVDVDLGVADHLIGGTPALILTFAEDAQASGYSGPFIVVQESQDLVRGVEEFLRAPEESEVARSARQIRKGKRVKKK